MPITEMPMIIISSRRVLPDDRTTLPELLFVLSIAQKCREAAFSSFSKSARRSERLGIGQHVHEVGVGSPGPLRYLQRVRRTYKLTLSWNTKGPLPFPLK